MKKYNFKSTIAALICACSLAFQAKAQTTTTTYDIGTVGSIKITSITDNTGATTYNSNGTVSGSTTGNTSASLTFNFSGTITDISKIKQGNTIAIPLTVAAGSQFPTLGLSFNPNLSINGQNLFTVSINGSNTIILTATAAVTGLTGEEDFNLQGTGLATTSGATAQQLKTGSTTYILDNNTALSYVINNTPLNLSPSNSCVVSSGNAAYSTYSNFNVMYYIYCVYNNLLANPDETQAQLLAAYPDLDSNLIEVVTIPANTQISSVSVVSSGKSSSYMNYVIPDNSSVSNTSIASLGGTTFSPVSITDTSMAGLDTTIKTGQYAIVKYPDNSYAIVVDWGALLNNTYTQYPAGSSVTSYDVNSDPLMQDAIGDKLSAILNMLNFVANFSNTAVNNSVSGVTVRSNIPSLLANGAASTLSNIATSNAPTGQSTVVVTYLNQYGVPIQQHPVYAYGWAPNIQGQTPSQFAYAPPKDTLGLTLLTPAQVQKLSMASKVGITSTTVDTAIAYGDTSGVYFIPRTNSSGALQVVQIYYIYGDLSTLPITGLQLSAQVQANNDVILTWGTLTEINSKTFTVQRSSDGGKTWVTIGTQPTQAQNGNSSVPLTYQLTDLSVPIGSYEYRVVETDIDGATTTSNVVQISITGGGQVFPNPANTILNVKLPANANNVPYRLISADGKIVLKGTVTNTGNYGQISVAGIASDIYFLQITVNSAMQTYEVRIQH